MSKQQKNMDEVLDKLFAPDIIIQHNALGEILSIKAVTPAGKDYMKHTLIFRYQMIDDFTFPNLCVEYVDMD